jgi:hypothetical protein
VATNRANAAALYAMSQKLFQVIIVPRYRPKAI